MNLKRLSQAVAAIAFWLPLTAFSADQYWAYTYKGIDVTAEGSASYARTIAHNLHRLEVALAVVLPTKSEERPPTAVYAMPADAFYAVRGKKDDSVSTYYARPFGSTMLINASYKGDDRYWSVYFAFTGSVLTNAYSMRYPEWFISGLSEVFAASMVDHFKVTIGGVNRGRAYTLTQNSLIPIKNLLALRSGDPQFASPAFQQLYAAEAWFLVHQIVIDQRHHSNFYEYFKRVDRGENEEAAFAASFEVSYETLDAELRDALLADKIRVYNVAVQDEEDAAGPLRLSEAEALGRLSIVAAEHGLQPDAAIKLSMQALKADPTNEDAQNGLARAQLRESDYGSALRTAEGLCANDKLAEKGIAACAFVFSSLASAVAAKKASIGIDQAPLAARALQYYEKAVALDPDDMKSWDGLLNLVDNTHDVAYAKNLVQKAELIQAKHPRVGVFDAAIASMYAMTGDYESAMKYALLWQNTAFSSTERARANTFMSRLKDSAERKHAAESPIAP